MTLYRQLLAAVIVLFLLLYSVNTLINIRSHADLVERQMQVHAQDTATSLALSMTQAAMDSDSATLETMFNAVSDRGYFQRIEFVDLKGNTVLEREFPLVVESVPDWFVRMIQLAAPPASAEVSSGWMRLGRVDVFSYPGQAYATLWSLTVRQLIWFLVVTLLVSLLSALALRVLLGPLDRVEAQARAICEQQFPVQERMPRTRELARVVEAMNRMARRLRQLFEGQLAQISRLQEQSFRDPVTGLSNRADFDARLQALAEDREEGGGALLILSVADFARVNRLAGGAEGNEVLRELGNRLRSATADSPELIVARRQGADFAIYAPGASAPRGHELAERLLARLVGVQWSGGSDDPLVVHGGLTCHSEFSSTAELLREADAALAQARLQAPNGWQEYREGSMRERTTPSPEQWRQILARCIEERRVTLAFQPLYSPDRTLVGQEVYVRLRDEDQLILPGVFLPAAERYGVVAAIDRLMLEALAARSIAGTGLVSVNLSGAAAADAEFRAWLTEFLVAHHALAARLVLEFAERHLTAHGEDIARLQKAVAAFGTRIAVDHFGRSSLALQQLHSLPLQYLKLHRSFVRGVDGSTDQQAFIHALVQMARAREIELHAEGVESAAEFEALQGLGVSAMEGYYLGAPESDPVT